MSETPFYLQGTGPNLLTEPVLDSFFANNPELGYAREEYELELRTLDMSHFESFCAWILSQQISGRVAELLFERLQNLVNAFTPQSILELDHVKLREIGLSRTKAQYVHNLATFYQNERDLDDLHKFDTREIMDHYLQIKGIGPWTVNMFMIFNLGRLDIAAPKDLVVRKGMRVLYDLPEVPTVEEAKRMMEPWGEVATVGTILSWAAMGE